MCRIRCSICLLIQRLTFHYSVYGRILFIIPLLNWNIRYLFFVQLLHIGVFVFVCVSLGGILFVLEVASRFGVECFETVIEPNIFGTVFTENNSMQSS